MKKLFTIILCLIISASVIFLVIILSSKEDVSNFKELKIGSCEYIDLIYPTANILCTIINTECLSTKRYAEVEVTDGSNDSIVRLLAGNLNMSLVDDIVAETAYKGTNDFSEYSNRSEIRSVCSFYQDSIIFIVNEKSNIKSFKDIKGKKISISLAGNNGVHGKITDEILDFYKIKPDEFEEFSYGFEKSIIELENGNIDGFMYLVAMPNSSLFAISHSKNIKCRLISVEKDLSRYLQRRNPLLKPVVIPKTMYPEMTNKTDVTTLGNRVLLVALESMNNNTVYEITKAICQDFHVFKSVHPAFNDIIPESIAKNLTLPIHSGALKYYKEAGLARYIDNDLILK